MTNTVIGIGIILYIGLVGHTRVKCVLVNVGVGQSVRPLADSNESKPNSDQLMLQLGLCLERMRETKVRNVW